MQIDIEVDGDIIETAVIIKCAKRDAYVERLIAALRMIEKQITVTQNGNVTVLGLEQILYIESVDRKCFVYTADEIYESAYKLYELEQQLGQYLFVRINKSCVVNCKNIDSIKTYIDRRLSMTMSNGEQLIVSRQYAPEIRMMLGVK